MPRAIALEMLFSLKSYGADRLFELGVINEIVEESQLLVRTEEVAIELLAKGPLSLMAMKELVNFDPNLKERLDFSAKAIVPVANSRDTLEAVRALVEKREPEWELK